MTTSNINKFVRGNLNLKPWVLSKKPTDIVNSYVQRLYQKNPYNFKNDLEKPRLATLKHEVPLRSCKPVLERLTFPIINKPKSKLRSNTPLMPVRNTFIAAPKKSPNYKIYNTRHFTSSASSSSASIFRKNYEERRKGMYKPANGMQFRTFSGSAAMTPTNFYNSPGVAKYIAPTRLYNNLSNQLKTFEITNNICKDLMSVDEVLKQKIRVIRSKVTPPEPVELNKDEMLVTSFNRMNHQSMLCMNRFNGSKPVAVKREPPFVSMPVKQKAHGGRIMMPSPTPMLENARYQLPNGFPYTGAGPSRSYFLKNSPKPEVTQTGPSKQGERYPLSLVCRSRNTRSGNSRRMNKSSQNIRKFL